MLVRDPYVTGTSVLAIRYADGVMMAADTLASYGSLARYKDVRRIRPLGQCTLLGGSGEYSDFQYLVDQFESLVADDGAYEDGSTLGPRELYSYLKRVMYQRRSKVDPLWNQLVVAGWRNGAPLLGTVDLYGTAYEDTTAATGYGAYIARPLLRKAYSPTLSFDAARAVLEDCMRVMYYRDARASCHIQIAHVDARGVTVEPPHVVSTTWTQGEAALGYPA